MKDKSCPKCGSSEIIENARILDYWGGTQKHNLGVTVYENPEAWIFKGETTSTLTVWVCGACGFAELYVKDPQKLLEVYRKRSATA